MKRLIKIALMFLLRAVLWLLCNLVSRKMSHELEQKREKAKKALKEAFGDVFNYSDNSLFVFHNKRIVRYYFTTETYQGAGLKGKGIENLIKRSK
jgi:hypothetical protein